MDKEKNFISAVIYVHNAERYINDFLSNLINFLDNNFEHSEIICVNDFSHDNSVDKIKTACKEAKNTVVSILNMGYFHGLEIAMNAGIDMSIGDYVLEIDSTVQDYNIEEIMCVYREVIKGNDIVSASPAKKQKHSSRLFYSIFNRFSYGDSKLQSETFRILSRRAINRINSISRTVPYRKGIYASCGLKTSNIQYEVNITDDMPKESRLLKRYRINLAIDTLLTFTNAGYFVSMMMSGLMLFISLFMIVYAIVIYCMAKPVEGWTTIILFFAVAFCGLFSILSIIIKYLQILLNLNFKRKKYSYESIEKLTK